MKFSDSVSWLSIVVCNLILDDRLSRLPARTPVRMSVFKHQHHALRKQQRSYHRNNFSIKENTTREAGIVVPVTRISI